MFTYIRQNFILLIIIAILALSFTSSIVFFNKKTTEIQQRSEELVSYNQEMGALFIAFQERIISQNLINQRRDVFMIYAMDIIAKNYISHRSTKYSEMSHNDIIIFLDEIYSNSVATGINPFLPLAFARVETQFYNEALGVDGERSVFQFMEATARETYRKLNLPYLEDWWRDPKETVRLWFAYYHELSNHFVSESEERSVRWTALAYNAGLYRNRMKYNFANGAAIDEFVSSVYIYNKGNKHYNREIWNTYITYKHGFELKNTEY
jgi:soluble lytic murein transglycosylase-like protein